MSYNDDVSIEEKSFLLSDDEDDEDEITDPSMGDDSDSNSMDDFGDDPDDNYH